jgi:hypothetical protein
MCSIKDKIRIERLRKEICNPYKDREYNMYPNKIVKDYNLYGFRDMTEEEIVTEYYNSGFIKYCNYYLYFLIENKNIVPTLLSEVKYDKNQSNPLEHYELQLYRAYLIVVLLLREYKIQCIPELKNKTIEELEEMIDQLTLEHIDKIKNNKWWKLWQ